jgi:hypothetical protein
MNRKTDDSSPSTSAASIKYTEEERAVFTAAAKRLGIGLTTFLKLSGRYAADHLEHTGSMPVWCMKKVGGERAAAIEAIRPSAKPERKSG